METWERTLLMAQSRIEQRDLARQKQLENDYMHTATEWLLGNLTDGQASLRCAYSGYTLVFWANRVIEQTT